MSIVLSGLELIENAGPNSVQATLKHLLNTGTMADVQVAFTTSSGLSALLTRLRKVASKGKVRFLTGLYQGCTEPAALRTLLRAQHESGNRVEVRLSPETRFHRKAYLIRTRQTFHLVVGSSNLTGNGLVSAGELSVLASFTSTSSKAKSVAGVFHRAWDEGVPLTAARIKKYNANRVAPIAPLIPKRTLVSILGGRAKHEKADADVDTASAKPRFWLDGFSGYVKEQTRLIVADETNWDKNRWQWFATYAAAYVTGDQILILDRKGATGWAYLARIVDTTKTATSTPDGRHFVAYKELPRTSRRKLTREMRALLRQAGLTRMDGTRLRISAKTWSRVLELM